MLKEIETRRSIRRFTQSPLTDSQLEQLLRAAMQAPSARNQQPWEFVVVKNRETFEKIVALHPYASPLMTAAAGIVICGDTRRELSPGYWVQDCSAATQNLLLEAVHMGLGAVWLGIYPRDDRVEGLAKLLKLPEHVLPLAVVAVGHPDEGVENKFVDRFDPDRIHKEMW